jgi:AraC-like DNA-binding protein
MSRSAFAVRFKDLVGETPLEYLTGWRMQKATGLLQKGDKKLFEVSGTGGSGLAVVITITRNWNTWGV